MAIATHKAARMFFAALLIVKLRLSFAHAGNQGEIHRGNLVEKFFQVEAFAGKMVNRDISWITCCDHGYGRPSWRPRVSAPATYRSGKETNPAVSRDGCPGGPPASPERAGSRWRAGMPILFALAALPSSQKLRRDKPLSPASGFPVSWSRDSNS